MKNTAVDWLYRKLVIYDIIPNEENELLSEMFKTAKKIEEQEHKYFFDSGFQIGKNVDEADKTEAFEFINQDWKR